jgi:hypothetical protein
MSSEILIIYTISFLTSFLNSLLIALNHYWLYKYASIAFQYFSSDKNIN